MMIRRCLLVVTAVLLALGLVAGVASGAAATAAPPVVKHVTPHKGAATGGTEVAISGSNLQGATAVLFGTRAARRFFASSRSFAPSALFVEPLTTLRDCSCRCSRRLRRLAPGRAAAWLPRRTRRRNSHHWHTLPMQLSLLQSDACWHI